MTFRAVPILSLVSNDGRGLKPKNQSHHDGDAGLSLVSNDGRGLKPLPISAAALTIALSLVSNDGRGLKHFVSHQSQPSSDFRSSAMTGAD